MNILYTNFHRGDGGGHTTYVHTLAEELSARHRIFVAASRQSKLHRRSMEVNSVVALDQPFQNPLPNVLKWSNAYQQLRSTIQAHKIDVVHVNGSRDHSLVLRAIRGIRPRPIVVFTQHNDKPIRSIGKRYRARYGTDGVIAVCEYSRRKLLESPFRNCPLAVVPNGVNLRHFRPVAPSRAAQAREQWSAGRDIVIGSNAGTDTHKGWMDIVEALALLPHALRSKVQLIVAGALDRVDAHRRKRIRSLGLMAQVTFSGILDDVRPMLASLDAGFVLSHPGIETISFACREMMAMGKPVIISDTAGLPENVRPGTDGWLVPAGDRRAIANILRNIIQQHDDTSTMGRSARAHAERSFGLDSTAHATETFYLELAAKTRRSAGRYPLNHVGIRSVEKQPAGY